MMQSPALLQRLARPAGLPAGSLLPGRAARAAPRATAPGRQVAAPSSSGGVAPAPRRGPPAQRRAGPPAPRASGGGGAGGGEGAGGAEGGGGAGLAVNAALLGLWAGLMAYVFVLAPNQTPTIDAFVVQKLVGLKADDPFQVNVVFTALWNCMGLYPLIYAAILIPGARTDKLPAWPFVCASVFLGAYALIPYMALWAPKSPPEALPPPAAELEGPGRFYMRAAETPWLGAALAAGAGYWLLAALSAGGGAWAGYLQLFDESRLVHATSVDFALCTLLMPFWMANDAQGRNWDKSGLVPLLCLLPLVGPATYLLLRPKTYDGSSSASS
ncbi:hypothetical protein HT031_000174 [Scenedesmus sp. PABB004]|nr:hypothetical protein HT031_000174 [Scenedesmus sp. PABB004]